MKAAIYSGSIIPGKYLKLMDIERPEWRPGHVLLRVLACGVCRTDLHIVEGDIPPILAEIIPGHQIVGEVVDGATIDIPLGSRVGVSWMGGVDGNCWFCQNRKENLCDHPIYTGYSVNGGYAEYALVRSDFTIPLPQGLKDEELAPLLCAGIIGYRSLRMAEVLAGEKVGIFGFGNSASLIIEILQLWNCEVYVVTRGIEHRKKAKAMGATWIGEEEEKPPVLLDRAITFAPSGKVVKNALSRIRKGGIVAINAIHLDSMPAFDYDTLLWGERQIRSVTNMTRQDALDYLKLAHDLQIKPEYTCFPLAQANEALLSIKNETGFGSAILIP